MNKCSSKSSRAGFTLVELLVVLVIVGVLAAIALPKFARTKDRARVMSMVSDLRNYQTTQEIYRTEDGITAYGTPAELTTALQFQFSTDNVAGAHTEDGSNYTISLTNNQLPATTSCHLSVGPATTDPLDDGKIICVQA